MDRTKGIVIIILEHCYCDARYLNKTLIYTVWISYIN